MKRISPIENFHPLVREWFYSRFKEATLAQTRGWESISQDLHTLIAAPTGSGKTLAAFLVSIDTLIQERLAGSSIKEGIQILYISPLKALGNDIARNLELPLRELQELAESKGMDLSSIRAEVRTGDTGPYQRQKMLKNPPQILVTTPESFFLLLTSEKSRGILKNLRSVIVDEIHALAGDKRGAHLSLSLERLNHLAKTKINRVGLSATQKPLDLIAKFLVGNRKEGCSIVNVGHTRELDLEIEVPQSELSALCSHDQWSEVYQSIGNLVTHHRSTLIFVNTRKLAERVTFHLSELLGEQAIASHHGSLAKEKRLEAEYRLKNGQLKAIVATASMELGIDIGYVDLVCQIGSPRRISTFLQRVGRSGHAVGALPKGRLFALTRDELIECMALVSGVRQGILDAIKIPEQPIDILAQQVIATCTESTWDLNDLFNLCRCAYPYRNLELTTFLRLIELFSGNRGEPRSFPAYLHFNRLEGKLSARRSARLTALTNGGAIPEQALYRVVNIEDGTFVGTVDEDFALERPPGHIFLLGNTSWRIVNTRGTQVSVRDAHGAPPTIPFWFGEAPGRSLELSTLVSELREAISLRLPGLENPCQELETVQSAAELAILQPQSITSALEYLVSELKIHKWPIIQAIFYLAVQKAAMGRVPTQKEIVFERFFDASGGMQLVVHAPFGIQINRAWGLALRKRFCRSFDFELQALADDEGILLSLGASQSFPIEQLFTFLNVQNTKSLLEQAFLQAPYFKTRWQWNANRSLAVLRYQGGKKVPPILQKMRGEDLLTSAFPDVNQCLEHVSGDISIPYDHPLVAETMHDCLHEVSDLPGLIGILEEIHADKVKLIALESREPSPFSYGRLNAAPYAFLDDAPLEERRTRALAQRRELSIEELKNLGALDPEILTQVRKDSWPLVRDENELYEVLMELGILRNEEIQAWESFFKLLQQNKRAFTFNHNDHVLCYCLERIPLVKVVYGLNELPGEEYLPDELSNLWEKTDAIQFLIRSRLSVQPVLCDTEIAKLLCQGPASVRSNLEAIEAQGSILRGDFLQNGTLQWCERRLLQRIQKLTIEGLRQKIKPVDIQTFIRFLFQFHGLDSADKTAEDRDLMDILCQLQGFEAACGEWELEILPSRLKNYEPSKLDELCFQGLLSWGRMKLPKSNSGKKGINRSVPIAFFLREHLAYLVEKKGLVTLEANLSGKAENVFQILQERGALFFSELGSHARLLPSELDEALGELVRLGLISADGFSAIRPHISEEYKKREKRMQSYLRRYSLTKTHTGGRWNCFPSGIEHRENDERLDFWAWLLLQRWGVIFRDLLYFESSAPAWSDLVKVYRRLELRGEIRGGRFIAGVGGEQFALPNMVEKLRAHRETKAGRNWVVLSASDPLNLTGMLAERARIPASSSKKLLFCSGVLTAVMHKKSGVEFLVPVDQEMKLEMELFMRSRPVLRKTLKHYQKNGRNKIAHLAQSR